MSIFIDNIKIMGPKNTGVIARINAQLTVNFEMVDMRLISFYLVLKVDKDYQKKMIKLL